MVFSVGEMLSYASRTITLRPGDLLATGTPPGVGYIRQPPVYLVPGDVVEVEVEGIGVLRTRIVDSSQRGQGAAARTPDESATDGSKRRPYTSGAI